MSARLEADVLGWAKVYAKQRDVSLATVLEAALREFREACEGGVPELGGVQAVKAQVPTSKMRKPPATSYEEMMRERQQRLNRGRS